MTDKTIIVIEEKVIESIKRDTYSVVSAFVLIGVGVYLESWAMEWFGFLMAMIVMFGKASGIRKKMSMTPDEAITRINEIKAEGKQHDT